MRERINTERLLLRPVAFKDASAFSRLGSDFEIAKMTGSFPHPFPLLSAEFKVMHLMSQRQRGLAYPYAITQDGGDLMGIMDLFRRDETAPFEIGYWIGRPYWGHGYATEAARALIQEARKTLGLSTVIAGVFSDNPASLHLLKKLGFKVLGTSEPYFSMARLSKAESLDLKLSFDTST